MKSALDLTSGAGREGLVADWRVAGLHAGVLSGLAFAGVNLNKATGLLTALEVANLDL